MHKYLAISCKFTLRLSLSLTRVWHPACSFFEISLTLDQDGDWTQEKKVQSPPIYQQLGENISL